MNVPYNEINLTDAAQRIGVSYSLLADWCKRKLINYVDLSEGKSRPRYMLIEKEVEHLRAERKKHGRGFIREYDKNWDMPKVVCEVPTYEEDAYEETPVEQPDTISQDDAPTRKKLNLDDITTTISYMQDINDRLTALEIEKKEITEKLNDIEAEKNQLVNEYSELKSEIMRAL